MASLSRGAVSSVALSHSGVCSKTHPSPAVSNYRGVFGQLPLTSFVSDMTSTGYVTQSGPKFGTISIEVVEAKNLPTSGKSSRIDPWVKIGCVNDSFKTSVLKKNSNPHWNEKFEFDVDINNSITFTVFDKNLIGKAVYERDTRVGKIKIRVSSLVPEKIYDKWLTFRPYKLKGGKNKVAEGEAAKAELHVKIVLKVFPHEEGRLICRTLHFQQNTHSLKTDEYQLPADASEINRSVHLLQRATQKWIDCYAKFERGFRLVSCRFLSTDKTLHSVIIYKIVTESAGEGDKEHGYHAHVFHQIRDEEVSTKWVAKSFKKDCQLIVDTMHEAFEKGTAWVSENTQLFDMTRMQPEISVVHTNKTYHVIVWYYGAGAE